jgi:tripartite-type tricarboxylate transporter receptor subunit TctC
MRQVFASGAYQAGLKKRGYEPFPLTPAQGAAFIKAEVDKWAAVAKSANIQVD